MTNDEIQEASRLIGEIATLEGLGAEAEFVVAQRSSSGYYWPISSVGPGLARELMALAIVRKKARLNDLRAGC